jgi:flavin reductase (DIM6/NTAB) family NADH-FMN oxidoreductase RutF
MSEIEGRLGSFPGDQDRNEGAGQLDEDPVAGRWLRRHLAAGVVALTTVIDGGFRAATSNTCAVASLDPLLMSISIETDSQMDEWLTQSGRFAVSILPWRQKFFADQFAGFTPLASPTFSGIDYFTATTGCPILSACTGWADCQVDAQIATGDHRLFVGAVVAAGAGPAEHEPPLIYYLSRYAQID